VVDKKSTANAIFGKVEKTASEEVIIH